MGKRVGVLTSGGDCAGLNAAIRAIGRHAILNHDFEVIGIKQGTTGLINRPIQSMPITLEMCDSHMLRTGGTMLGSTNKGNPFNFLMADGSRKDVSDMFIEAYHELNLDAIIGIGGDGSMSILRDLAKKGKLNLVGIPKTIDNDISQTEVAIGYSTAVSVATQALDCLQPTAASHQRVMILEVMGRDAGHIALSAGVAGGADVILIPEMSYSIEKICEKIKSLAKAGRTFSLIIVAEAVKMEDGKPVTAAEDEYRARYGGIGQYLGTHIEKMIGAETRVTALGHIQRGGQPVPLDRIISSAFGVAAVDLVAQEKFDRMVIWQNRRVTSIPIQQAIADYHCVQPNDILLHTSKGLGIYIGEKFIA